MTLTHTPGYYLENGVIYPESDGERMAENTRQADWIALIKGGIEGVFEDDPNVFVAGDLLWYSVQGRNRVAMAPDTMVAFGRPKGPRGSYLQWLENDIPPQVVFEVLSPSNTTAEMQIKYDWYERYGVEEYYIYDPDRVSLKGYLRQGERLEPIAEMQGWVSPRLGIRFEMAPELRLYEPDGTPFISKVAERRQRRQAELRIIQEQEQHQETEIRLEQERQKVERERQQRQQAENLADLERQAAEKERQAAEKERQRAERLAALLRESGIAYDE